MRILVGLENNVEGRSLAWALEHPGCYAYGANQDAALTAVPRAVIEYFFVILFKPEATNQKEDIIRISKIGFTGMV